MKRTVQTSLFDFDESAEKKPTKPKRKLPEFPSGKLWRKTIKEGEEWGVCQFDETVFLVQLIDGRIHAHGTEAVCKWCGGVLAIHEKKVFCEGMCKKYQGEFSRDPNAFLQLEGVKAYTLRQQVAEAEGLQLEQRDLELIAYADQPSFLEEFEEEFYED